MKKFIIFFSGALIINISAPFSFSQTKFFQLSNAEKNFSEGKIRPFAYAQGYVDSLKPKPKTDKPFKMKKSPLKAVLLSAVIPGAGQFYNESYWKIPFIAGICGYLGYEIYNQDKKYRDYRDQYSASQTQNPPDGDLNLKSLRQFYFNQRNDFIWYFTIAYVVNLVDAYIGAHLFDFDVKEEKMDRLGVVDRKLSFGMKIKF